MSFCIFFKDDCVFDFIVIGWCKVLFVERLGWVGEVKVSVKVVFCVVMMFVLRYRGGDVVVIICDFSFIVSCLFYLCFLCFNIILIVCVNVFVVGCIIMWEWDFGDWW